MQYNLMTSKGYFSYSDICFGRLGEFPIPISSLLNESFGYGSFLPAFLYKDEEIDSSDLIAIDYPISQATTFDDVSPEETIAFWEVEIPALLNQLTIYRGGYSYNEKTRTVRVYAKQPADRMMTLLFLIRNLTLMSATARSYKAFRDEGFTELESAVGCHFLGVRRTFSSGQLPFPQRIGEYNWFNPHTISLEATKNLLKQVEPNWYFTTFVRTENGYTRDYDLTNIHFMDYRGEPEDGDDWYDEDQETYNGNTYKLVDIFSIKGDYAIPFPTLQENENGGGPVIREDVSFKEFVDVFRELVSKVKDDSTD